MVGELRDREAADICLKAAETGHLVITSLHTPDVPRAIGRLVGLFPADEQESVRARLADNLQAVIALRLLMRADATGLIPAVEALLATTSVRELIRDGSKVNELRNYMDQAGADLGMHSFDQYLFRLHEAKRIGLDTALANATQPRRPRAPPHDGDGRPPRVSPAGAPAASRVLVVGSDADVSIALHLHLERAGHAVYCLPGPGELEGFVRAAAPQVLVLLLPAVPDASWGAALTTAASAARVGVRVVVVAPSREIVEPLAAVAGAERALARVEVLARPLAVMDRGPGRRHRRAHRAAPAAPRPTGRRTARRRSSSLGPVPQRAPARARRRPPRPHRRGAGRRAAGPGPPPPASR